MRFTQAGQAEQTAQRLAQVAHRFIWRNEGQSRTFYRLLAVQPPQAVAQRQRFDLLQHGRKAIAHAIGLAQQTGAAPDQFFEVVSGNAEADHLRIQRQFLRRALQQFQQCFGRTGTAQSLTQVSLAKGAGEQLQKS
ncbi:hypothetical protein PS645_02235 [Pseudomonas fluorescens]|uniref:Uncharacterized protein n=1 Tax=Pseudomonas fluorescens TaxID=294 RepID=A0A5E6SHQ8_PSEFL|nr:hypothetical protein PS645_02235 [Pseudomonas fluorescens]